MRIINGRGRQNGEEEEDEQPCWKQQHTSIRAVNREDRKPEGIDDGEEDDTEPS